MRARNLLSVLCSAAVLGGCTFAPGTPAAVRPSLDGWRALGMSCAGPNQGGEPNDLVQWSCTATVRGATLSAVLDGDDQGVFSLQAGVPAATDLSVARDVLADVARATAALGDQEADVEAWLRSWDGADAAATFGTAWVHAQRDATWTMLTVFPGPRRSLSDPTP